MRTVTEIVNEMASIRTDETMSDSLWQQVFAQLTRELEAAKMAAPFDYDALIKTARQDDDEAWRDCACGCGDAPEYDRQWAVWLHTLAGIVYAYAVALPFVLGLVAAVVR